MDRINMDFGAPMK